MRNYKITTEFLAPKISKFGPSRKITKYNWTILMDIMVNTSSGSKLSLVFIFTIENSYNIHRVKHNHDEHEYRKLC